MVLATCGNQRLMQLKVSIGADRTGAFFLAARKYLRVSKSLAWPTWAEISDIQKCRPQMHRSMLARGPEKNLHLYHKRFKSVHKSDGMEPQRPVYMCSILNSNMVVKSQTDSIFSHGKFLGLISCTFPKLSKVEGSWKDSGPQRAIHIGFRDSPQLLMPESLKLQCRVPGFGVSWATKRGYNPQVGLGNVALLSDVPLGSAGVLWRSPWHKPNPEV